MVFGVNLPSVWKLVRVSLFLVRFCCVKSIWFSRVWFCWWFLVSMNSSMAFLGLVASFVPFCFRSSSAYLK